MPSETTPLVDDSVKSNGIVVDYDYDWASSQNKNLSTLLGVTQLVLIVLFGLGTTYTSTEDDESYSTTAEYIVFRDIMVMLLLGFGYLMTFLSKYGLGAVGFTLILTSLAIQLNIIVELACRKLLVYFMDSDDDESSDDTSFPMPLTIATLIDGEFAAATLLISFGAIIGRASPCQLVIMALCQSIFYACNKAIFVFGIIGSEDVGGSMTIHMFGAYFGLAVSHILGPPQSSSVINNCKPNATSDLTALIGTTLLWVYWPSFVGATETGNSRHENLCVLHTVLALIGSTVAAFLFSPRLSHHKNSNKLDPVHIANSTLAGGVAVGSSARLYMTPVGALVLGFVAGTVSVHGYAYSTPALEKCSWLRIYDTCGVGNLHGWPSLVGGLSSVIFILMSSTSDDDSSFLVHGTGMNQCLAQVAGVVCTLFLSMSSGYVTGIVMKKVGSTRTSAIIDEYDDAVWWEGEYFEDAAAHADADDEKE